jgi:hypothetical protein
VPPTLHRPKNLASFCGGAKQLLHPGILLTDISSSPCSLASLKLNKNKSLVIKNSSKQLIHQTNHMLQGKNKNKI